MGLVSTFHAGHAAEIAAALRSGADPAAGPGLSVPDGLSQPDLDQACRELARIRRQRVAGLKAYVSEVLDGDGDESQVVRLAPRFVRMFAALTADEAAEVARRMAEREREEDRAFRERWRERASRPLQDWKDGLALVAMPLVLWRFTRSAALAAAGAVVFVAVTLLVLPWVRRRKIPPPAVPSDALPPLLDLASLCGRVERERLDLVYEWMI